MAEERRSTEVTGDTHAATERTGRGLFSRMAIALTEWSGSGWAAATIGATFVVWVAVGAAFHFVRWWELCATVGLPFLTLLMLALIQHTQNHNAIAIQLKLDELIRTTDGASNKMMTVEYASRDDLDRIQDDFRVQSDETDAGGEDNR